jgi:hypothetical protein
MIRLYAGVRQGDTLSPLKFVIWMDTWLYQQEIMGEGIVIGEKEYVGSGFVDDLVAVCRGRQPAVRRTKALSAFMVFNGMGIQDSKSHLMVVRASGTKQRDRVPPIRVSSWDFKAQVQRSGWVEDVGDKPVNT